MLHHNSLLAKPAEEMVSYAANELLHYQRVAILAIAHHRLIVVDQS